MAKYNIDHETSDVPLKEEFYGCSWIIVNPRLPRSADPIVIVPDPGDGSAKERAQKILGLLNGEG